MKKQHLNSAPIAAAIALVFWAVHATYLPAATTGKIAGKVIDSKTSEPLPGANVFVEGTTLGAASDLNGDYFILNLPPGTYVVVAKMMGYGSMKKQDVLVRMDLTTPLDFGLNTTVLEGKEVVVVATRPVIQVDVASSQTTLDGAEIRALAVNNFKDLLDKQLGIRDMDMRGIFMRGQRQSEISLLVDGMETRENVDDMIYTRFNPDELVQAEINAGGYNAEYGNASAGVISLVTKEGGRKFSGTFDLRQSIPGRKHFGPPLKYYWDQYFLGQPDSWWQMRARTISKTGYYKDFRNRPELLKELYRWRMRDEATEYGNKPDLVASGTFGGTVPFLKNTTFFTSYRREKNYYLYPGILDHFFDQNGLVKLTSQLTSSIKLSFNVRYMETTGLNRYDYYLMESARGDLGAVNPDFQTEKRYIYENVEQVAWSGYGDWPYTGQMGKSSRFRNQYGLTFTHIVTPRTFYEVKLTANRFRSYGRQGEPRDTTAAVTLVDPLDPAFLVTLRREYALAPVGYWETGFQDPFGINMAGTYGYGEMNFADDISLTANLTSQINKINQVNLGFQYSRYDIKKDEIRFNPPSRDDRWQFHVYPQKLAFWASDKLEFEGMVLDLGLRTDVRIPDEVLDWRHHPWDYHWSDLLPADSNLVGPRYRPPWKWALAPRFKIAHPIGETAKIYFNWGHYYQDPPFERQYMFSRRQAQLKGEGWTTYGDPEMPYIKSVQYEIGYEHNLFGIFRVAMSGYYKDVKYLLTDRFRMDGMPRPNDPYEPNYAIDSPNRYLSSQGFEVRVDKKMGRFWTALFNYNLEMYTRGVFGYANYHEDPNLELAPLDYAGQNIKRPPESRFNLSADLHTPNQFGVKFLGFYPFADINMNFLLWWRQQPAFTYNPQRLTGLYAPNNNLRWKAHWAVNMTFNKRFDFGGPVAPVLYTEIYNLWNTKNMFRGAFGDNVGTLEKYIADVLAAGGKPGERGDLAAKVIGNHAPEQILPLSGTIYDLYLNPRQIWLGIRIELK